MKIINLTPHAINVVVNGQTRTFPSEGVARATQTSTQVGSLEGIPVFRMEYGAPVDLPDPEEGVYYVVSAITATAARESGRITSDLLLTANLVRDEAGRVVGCGGFSAF